MGLFDALFGGGSSGADAAYDAINRNRQLLDGVALPEYETYIPELYDYESANYELVDEDPALRAAQLDALGRLSGLAETGLSDVDAAGFNNASRIGQQVAKQGRASAINDANSRGVGGSGLEFAMREAGLQSGAEASQKAALETAAEAAKQRALYQTAFSDAVSRARADDNKVNSQNVGIINQFNKDNTAGRNQTAVANTNARNDAFKYNEGLKDKNFNNQMSRATGYSNLNNQHADVAMAEDEARRKRNQAVTGLIGAGIGGAVGGSKGAQVGYGVGSAL